MDAAQLQSLPLFEGLSDDDMKRCADLFQLSDMHAGAHLADEGDHSYRFFIVLEGQVEVVRDTEILATLGSGEFFGEAGVMADDRRNAVVRARSSCRVASMMSWDFRTMTDEFPDVARRIEKTAAERGRS